MNKKGLKVVSGKANWRLKVYTVNKSLAIFPSPAGMSLTTLSLARNYLYMTSLFLPRESLVSDIPAGDGILANLFLQCTQSIGMAWLIGDQPAFES